MPYRNESGLFGALEAELRKAKDPVDCATLFDRTSIKAHAESVNRVSDYLGNLWRKGLVLRLPAPRSEGTKARWLYVWKDKGPRKKPPMPELSEAIEYNDTVNTLINRPNMQISEEGDAVVITLQYITITIKQN